MTAELAPIPVRDHGQLKADCLRYAQLAVKNGYAARIIRWSARLDNYEPVSRREASGYAVMYAGTLTERNSSGEITFRAEHATSGVYMAADDIHAIPLRKMISSGAIFDDGRSARPYYAGGWNPWDTAKSQDSSFHWGTGPHVLWHEFPVNANDPMQFGNWSLGPRTFYHFKYVYLVPVHMRPSGVQCRWSLCTTTRADTRCPDRCPL